MTMMKKFFQGMVMVMCISMLLSLFGCGKEKPQILDGPDMAYVPQWTEFTISRSDSYAQYNFWFTVTDADPNALVTGECLDEDGTRYEAETGIPISEEALWTLRRMDLEKLSEAVEMPDDFPELLDDSIITLLVTLENGAVVKKNVSSDLSFEIYQLLLPFFAKNQATAANIDAPIS